MKRGLYWRFSVMMFLQYAIWGAWMPVLYPYLLRDASFNSQLIGIIYALLPLGIMLSPVTGGQLADRYVPIQWLLVGANLLSAVILYVASTIDYGAIYATAPAKAFWTLAGLMFAHSLLFGPTLPLTNAICFRHMDSIEKDFGKIRVWGTLGWIAAGLFLMAWRQMSAPSADVTEQATTWIATAWDKVWTPASHAIGGALTTVLGKTTPRDCLLLASAFSVLLGLFSFALPNTPPKREGVEPLAFAKAFRLLKDTNFLIFMLISFVVTTELWFYYNLTSDFLETPQVGIAHANIPGWMATAQIGEVFTLVVLLRLLLPRLGVRWCIALGVLAWPIRYGVFAIGHPWWAIVASLPLHGFCYVFFFVVGQIYSDSVAPKDIRASVQSLWAVFVLGIGSIVGSYLASWVQGLFTTKVLVAGKIESVINYRGVFLVPFVATIVCAIIFLLLFREPQKKAEPSEAKAA